MEKSIYSDVLVTLSILDGAADNETINGDAVDMQGFDGVAFKAVAGQGQVAEFTLKVQQDTASDMSSAADLEGSAKAFSTGASSDGEALVDIFRPQERYLRPVLVVPDLTTPAPVCVIAMQYRAQVVPVSNTNAEFLVSPDEGAA